MFIQILTVQTVESSSAVFLNTAIHGSFNLGLELMWFFFFFFFSFCHFKLLPIYAIVRECKENTCILICNQYTNFKENI